MNKIKSNYLIHNTIILIITSLIVKVLSLVNRIIITRLLGIDGISLYILILPTIMLITSISSFSLNITISKITAENEKNKECSRKEIIKKGLKIGLYATLLTSILFTLSINTISFKLLKQPSSYYPLFSSLSMIPFAMANSVFRGFYNGLDNVKITSTSNLIEQISRMLFSFALLSIFSDYGVEISVTISIIAMTIGEICAFIYNLYKLNKTTVLKEDINITKKGIEKKIFSLSCSLSLSHLITNLTYFLEPIIYTFILTNLTISDKEIMYRYSEVNAYALPLLTMFMFTSTSIASVIIPIISKNNYNEVSSHISKSSIKLSLIPGLFLSIILFYYGDKYLYLLYKTTNGSYFVQNYAFIFTLFYINPILTSILQAHGKQKDLLIYIIIISILKLALIMLLSLSFGYKSLFLSVLLTNIIFTMILFLKVKKMLKIKFQFIDFISLMIPFFIVLYLVYILRYLNVNYIITSFISLFIYFIVTLLFKKKCII